MAQWLVNHLCVQELTRNRIINELFDVLSKEIDLLNNHRAGLNLAPDGGGAGVCRSRCVDGLGSDSDMEMPDKDVLGTVVSKLVEYSSILKTVAVKLDSRYSTGISLDESMIGSIVEEDSNLASCLHMPMFEKPLDWCCTKEIIRHEGGYLTNSLYRTESIVKTKMGCSLSGEIGSSDVRCLNLLQKTCYKLNKKFYDSIKKADLPLTSEQKQAVVLIDNLLSKIKYYDEFYFP